jgi:hypothetical protein
MDPTHPAVTILNDLFGPEWNAVDLLVRDDQAAIAEMWRDDLRETHILVARRGEWVAPGLLARSSTQVPVQRPVVTSRDEPILQLQQHASGWPSPDGSPPAEVWTSLDGILAEDAVAVSLTTSCDHVQVATRGDGTFLALVRASRGEEPDVMVHLRTGEQVQASL